MAAGAAATSSERNGQEGLVGVRARAQRRRRRLQSRSAQQLPFVARSWEEHIGERTSSPWFSFSAAAGHAVTRCGGRQQNRPQNPHPSASKEIYEKHERLGRIRTLCYTRKD